MPIITRDRVKVKLFSLFLQQLFADNDQKSGILELSNFKIRSFQQQTKKNNACDIYYKNL